MGYVVYGQAGYGSMVIEAALAEAGAPYDFVAAQKGADGAYGADLLALNPRGQVPVLVLPDGTAMAETSAMLLHVADAFPAAHLAPAPGTPARAQHDRWLAFTQANIYEGILRFNYPDRYVSDPGAAPAVRLAALDYVQQHFELLEAAVVGPCLFGNGVTVADLYIWMLAGWVDQARLSATCPRIMALCATIAARPALAGVVAANT